MGFLKDDVQQCAVSWMKARLRRCVSASTSPERTGTESRMSTGRTDYSSVYRVVVQLDSVVGGLNRREVARYRGTVRA